MIIAQRRSDPTGFGSTPCAACVLRASGFSLDAAETPHAYKTPHAPSPKDPSLGSENSVPHRDHGAARAGELADGERLARERVRLAPHPPAARRGRAVTIDRLRHVALQTFEGRMAAAGMFAAHRSVRSSSSRPLARSSRITARAKNRRFWLLSALRANTKAP